MPFLCPTRTGAAVALGLALLTIPAVSHAQITRVITNAASIPGEVSTLKFTNFSQVALNNSGQVAFYDAYTNSNGDTAGYFAAGTGYTLTTAGTVLKQGTTDPSLTNNTIWSADGMALDNTGRTLLTARSRPPGFSGTAGRVFSNTVSSGSLALYQDYGQAAPSGLGTFNAFSLGQGTDDGGATLIGNFQGAGSGPLVMRRTPTGTLIQASSINNGAIRSVATDRSTGSIAIAYQSGVTSTGTAAPTSFSELPFIARISFTAPGTGGATYVGFTGGIGTNGTGDVSFGATTRLLGSDKDGIFRYNASNSTTSLLAQVGQSAPGAANGFFFTSMDTPGLSREGTTFFEAQVGQFAGSGVLGLYAANSAASGNGLARIIQVGDALFGSRLQSFNWSGQPSVNDLGQIAFGYVLDNGERGIAITASRVGTAAPETASGLLFLGGLLPVVGAGIGRAVRGRKRFSQN